MAYVARHAGKVNDQGKVVFADPSAWRATCARLKGRLVWVTVRRQQQIRSPQANRYYFGVVVDSIASYIGESAEETHELLKSKFLPGRSVELLDGKTLEMPPTTRHLTVEQFAEYLNRVKQWAAEWLGLSIPEPGEVEVL